MNDAVAATLASRKDVMVLVCESSAATVAKSSPKAESVGGLDDELDEELGCMRGYGEDELDDESFGKILVRGSA